MPEVKPIRDGYMAITPYQIVKDAAGFLDFLGNAFEAFERMRLEMLQGGIGQAEVGIVGAVVMRSGARSPDFPTNSSQIPL